MTRLTLAISIILPGAAWGLMGCQGNGSEIIEDKLGISVSSPTLGCIAPANPGSGWDFTCRAIGKIMYDNGLVDRADPGNQHGRGRRWHRLQPRR